MTGLTDEQHAARAKGIGGSDAGAVLGVSKWRTPLDVYLEKVGDVEPDREQSDWQYWGHLLEQPIADEYMRRTGRRVRRDNRTRVHPRHEWMVGNIDRTVVGEPRILDMKTARYYDRETWGEPGSDEVPLDIQAQMLHYIAITGAQFADVAVLFMAERRFEIYTVERDMRFIPRLIDLERAFWARVQTRRPPSPVSAADVRQLWRDATETTAEATPEVLAAVERLADLKAERKAIDARIQDEEMAVLSAMGPAATLVDEQGRERATWRNQTARRVDMSALSDAHPEIVEQYRAESVSRVFRLKKLKD